MGNDSKVVLNVSEKYKSNMLQVTKQQNKGNKVNKVISIWHKTSAQGSSAPLQGRKHRSSDILLKDQALAES